MNKKIHVFLILYLYKKLSLYYYLDTAFLGKEKHTKDT